MQVDSFLDEYADKFFVAKAPRKLVWMKHLGSVDLTLTVHGVSKDFSVSPFEASILMAFQVRPPSDDCYHILCLAWQFWSTWIEVLQVQWLLLVGCRAKVWSPVPFSWRPPWLYSHS